MGCVVPNGDLLFTNYAVTAIGVRRLLYKGPYFCALHLDVMEGGGAGGCLFFSLSEGPFGRHFVVGGIFLGAFFRPAMGGWGFLFAGAAAALGGWGEGGGGGGRGAARPHCTAAPPPLYRRPPGQRIAGRRESDGIVSWRTVVLRQPGPGTGMTSPFAVQWHEADLLYSTLFFIYIYIFFLRYPEISFSQ